MVERLRRLDIVYPQSPVYFVTACTAERRALLANSEVHDAFVQYAQNGPTFGLWVGGYVLMPDHLHAFIAIDDRCRRLSDFVKSMKGTLSSVLRKHGHEPPYWQKGFFDYLLRSGDSYGAKWHYVRDNAVRAGLVSNWEVWPYAGAIHPLEYRRG